MAGQLFLSMLSFLCAGERSERAPPLWGMAAEGVSPSAQPRRFRRGGSPSHQARPGFQGLCHWRGSGARSPGSEPHRRPPPCWCCRVDKNASTSPGSPPSRRNATRLPFTHSLLTEISSLAPADSAVERHGRNRHTQATKTTAARVGDNVRAPGLRLPDPLNNEPAPSPARRTPQPPAPQAHGLPAGQKDTWAHTPRSLSQGWTAWRHPATRRRAQLPQSMRSIRSGGEVSASPPKLDIETAPSSPLGGPSGPHGET